MPARPKNISTSHIAADTAFLRVTARTEASRAVRPKAWRSIRPLLLVGPLLDRVGAHAAQPVEGLLVVDQLRARLAPERVLLRHEDGLLRAGLFAQPAEDAAQHVDVEHGRAALDRVAGLELGGHDVDRLGR